MAVERRGNPPDAALSFSQLRLLFLSVLVEAVRRIRYDCMNAVCRLLLQPVEAVSVMERCSSKRNRGLRCLHGRDRSLYCRRRILTKRVHAPFFSRE